MKLTKFGKIQLSSGHKVSWFGFGRKIFPGNSLPHVRLSSMPFWICGINFLKIFHFSRQGKHQHKFPKVWQIDENITKMQILHKHILVSFLLLFFNILLIIFFFFITSAYNFDFSSIVSIVCNKMLDSYVNTKIPDDLVHKQPFKLFRT